MRPLGEEPPGGNAKQYRRQSLDEEQPLPAFETAEAVQPEQCTRDRRADHGRDRHRRHEQRHDARALPRREPEGEIEDDAGKEARFRHPEQKAHYVEADRPGDEAHGGGDQPPGDHDARDPGSRAHPRQHEIARDLEQDVADEEDAGAEPEHRGREAEIGVHGERGEAHIDAVEEAYAVAQAQEGDEPEARLAQCLPVMRLVHRHLIAPRQVFRPPLEYARALSILIRPESLGRIRKWP
jgi:hypothetical protein